MSLKSSDGARELPNLIDTQFKARHIFTILVEFLLLVDLKQLFWVVNFRIHSQFFRHEILGGLTVKILIMRRFIWLISPLFILIILACTFSVDKVRGTWTFSHLLYEISYTILIVQWSPMTAKIDQLQMFISWIKITTGANLSIRWCPVEWGTLLYMTERMAGVCSVLPAKNASFIV